MIARKQPRYRTLIDAVSGAVKSESALPPNPSAVEQLANAIRDAAVEKPTAVGPTPEGIHLIYISASTWCTMWTTIEPSPTAAATRLTFPARASPTANTPGRLVSSI